MKRSFIPLVVVCALVLTWPVLAQRQPIPLVQGVQVGSTMFPPGDTAKGGQGQPVDGVQAAGMEMLKEHYHAHLSLFYEGEQIAVPYGIGILQPFRAVNGFVGQGQGFYWLHTHDATGIIHIESPEVQTYTLGQFFDVWGKPLGPDGAAGLNGKVLAFVGSEPYHGNPRGIPLRAHEQITLVIGPPMVSLPTYVFPSGL